MTCSKLGKLRELVAKIESVAGVAETLTPGTDSRFRVWDPKFEPNVAFFSRDFARKTLSNYGAIPTTKLAKITFTLEIRRTNSDDTPDLWDGTFLPACGLLQTIGSGLDVTYTPSSDCNDHHTLTIGVNVDGNFHVIHGAMGNAVFRGKVGEPMFVDFEFMGQYDEDNSSDTALSAAIAHEAGIPDPFQGIGLAYDDSGPDLTISTVNFDLGNNVVAVEDADNDTGYKRMQITDRDPKFSFNPERIPLATYDFWTKMALGTKVNASFYSGRSRNVWFYFPALQINGPIGEEDRNGVAALSVPFMVCSSDEDGDDEFQIVLS